MKKRNALIIVMAAIMILLSFVACQPKADFIIPDVPTHNYPGGNSVLTSQEQANVKGALKAVFAKIGNATSAATNESWENDVYSGAYDLTLEKRTVTINGTPVPLGNWLSPNDRNNMKVIFYDKDGEPIVSDASKAIELYAYMPQGSKGIITLTQLKAGSPTVYYAMNPDSKLFQKSILADTHDKDNNTVEQKDEQKSWNYAKNRVSVDDNTLDLFIAAINNVNGEWSDELRVSAFVAALPPLQRRRS